MAKSLNLTIKHKKRNLTHQSGLRPIPKKSKTNPNLFKKIQTLPLTLPPPSKQSATTKRQEPISHHWYLQAAPGHPPEQHHRAQNCRGCSSIPLVSANE